MSRRNLFFALAWLALAGPALATSLVASAEAPVRLASPAPGTVLQAGAAAEIAWEPLAAFGRLGPVDEWEAFLSLDGGTTYPLRVTPHLDRDLRRVSWRVPPVPAAEARLLIRFGHEGEEIYFELPQGFSIAASPALERPFELATVAAAPGEPALPGAAGVVAWVEGSRRGGGMRQVVAPPRPAFSEQVRPAAAEHHPVALASERASVDSPEAPAGKGQAAPPVLRGSPLRDPRTAALRSIDILLLTQRQNE
ncbi:MAG: hypothetical protein ACJ75H_07870 [Thermoanaerobaculia bacterium]